MNNEPTVPTATIGDPRTLGASCIELMARSQLVFAFGVFNIIDDLRPKFVFKYGGQKAAKIGATLTIYGHTILVEPVFSAIEDAIIEGYRLALKALKKCHPDWMVPPVPIDGPTAPEWNWVQLLDEYAQDRGWSRGFYDTTHLKSGKWHCALLVNFESFRTAVTCSNMEQARNNVAHLALHSFITAESHVFPILPADSGPAAQVKVQAQVAPGGQGKGKQLPGLGTVKEGPLPFRFHLPLAPNVSRSQTVPVRPAAQSSVQSSSGITRRRKKMRRGRGQFRYDYLTSEFGELGLNPPPPQGPKGMESKNANLIPLNNRRLSDVELPEPEDKCVPLRGFQEGLIKLGDDASYHSVMKVICETFNVECPDIRYEPHPDPNPSHSHAIFASFDAHPYLSRASPILLVSVNEMDPADVVSLGIKKVIMYLLQMLKSDSDVDSADEVFFSDFQVVRKLEVELEAAFVGMYA